MANSTGADKRTGLEGAVPTPPAAAVPLPTAARAVGQLGSTGPQGSVREDRGQRAGPLRACQPISFFRKASSCSSSLMPTNLSTTSPFFMASTVGTADTWQTAGQGAHVTGRWPPLCLCSPHISVWGAGEHVTLHPAGSQQNPSLPTTRLSHWSSGLAALTDRADENNPGSCRKGWAGGDAA